MMDDSMKEVLIDGNSPESFFRGLGAAVRSCEVSLLADYKIKFPETYREILLSLFGKNYGAGLTHIRTEAERNAEDFSFAFAVGNLRQGEPGAAVLSHAGQNQAHYRPEAGG